MPQKGDNYQLDSEKSSCNNGSSIVWNEELWGPTIISMTEARTKCTLYFKTMAKDKVLWETGQPNNSNFYYYKGEYSDDLIKESINAVNNNIIIKDGKPKYETPSDEVIQYLCTENNFEIQDYKYLKYNISSGSYTNWGYLIPSKQYQFYVYDNANLVGSEMFTFDFDNVFDGVTKNNGAYSFINYEPTRKIEINNYNFKNGFCLSATSNISLYKPDPYEYYYTFEISKIWLSNT